jgi:UDP-GlcNAc:undecaprenyl-phosphate GlcNAc-1-phosphate transferase
MNAALVALTLIGGLLGFLRYNTFPARIFMGDSGSQFLGYMVGCLAILVSQGEACAISPAVPLLILGLPILDTLSVMTLRIRQKRSPFSPDKNHIHHQLMSLGLKHFEAVGLIYVIQVVLMVSAYLLRYEHDFVLLLFYLIFSVVFVGLLSFGKRKKALNSSMAAIEARDRRNHLLRKFNWYYEKSAVVIEVAIGTLLIMMATMVVDIQSEYFSMAVLFIVLMILVMFSLKRFRELTVRLCSYSACVFVTYLFSKSGVDNEYRLVIDVFFIAVVAFLMLAIKMTRREDFMLDTQDLLVLFMVIIVPQLPFETLSENSVSLIALRLAVLMYSCEFVLGRKKTKYKFLIGSSLVSFFIIILSGFI